MISSVHRSSQLLGTAARRQHVSPAVGRSLHRHGTAAASTSDEAASMGHATTDTATTSFVATSEPALQHLAAVLAGNRRAGDCYCLFGAVGAGKSVFSRAYIRAAVGDPDLTVPSPTFLLQQIYDECEGPPIHHFDLYRLLGGKADLQRLNLAASFEQSVSLVEWAERLQEARMLPSNRLEVHIEALDTESRHTQQSEEQPSASQPASYSTEADTLPDDTDAAVDPYTDQRRRQVRLRAHGTRWQQCLQHLTNTLQHHEQLLFHA